MRIASGFASIYQRQPRSVNKQNELPTSVSHGQTTPFVFSGRLPRSNNPCISKSARLGNCSSSRHSDQLAAQAFPKIQPVTPPLQGRIGDRDPADIVRHTKHIPIVQRRVLLCRRVQPSGPNHNGQDIVPRRDDGDITGASELGQVQKGGGRAEFGDSASTDDDLLTNGAGGGGGPAKDIDGVGGTGVAVRGDGAQPETIRAFRSYNSRHVGYALTTKGREKAVSIDLRDGDAGRRREKAEER